MVIAYETHPTELRHRLKVPAVFGFLQPARVELLVPLSGFHDEIPLLGRQHRDEIRRHFEA
jgi:hypothetical protein